MKRAEKVLAASSISFVLTYDSRSRIFDEETEAETGGNYVQFHRAEYEFATDLPRKNN